MRRRINGTYITHLTPALITHSVRYLLWFRTIANPVASNPNHQLQADIKTHYKLWTPVRFIFEIPQRNIKQSHWSELHVCCFLLDNWPFVFLFFFCWFVTEMIACQMDPTFIAHDFARYLRLAALQAAAASAVLCDKCNTTGKCWKCCSLLQGYYG